VAGLSVPPAVVVLKLLLMLGGLVVVGGLAFVGWRCKRSTGRKSAFKDQLAVDLDEQLLRQ
jgi:hypothetical protein